MSSVVANQPHWNAPVNLLIALTAIVIGAWAMWRVAPPPQVPMTEYPMLQPNDIPAAIAVGKDGAVWFTIDFSNAIGVFRNGKIERIPKGGTNRDPIGIDVDDAGNAWYADTGALSIGRVSKNNEIKNFSLGTPIARMNRLAIAPDGAVWFAENSSNSVTRLKDDTLERYDMQATRGTPYGIAVDKHGNAWATLQAAGQIVRINTQGKLDWFWVPTPASAPTDIVADRDGTIWFLEFRSNKLGRFKNEEFSEYPVPSEFSIAGLAGLAAAPNSDIWFAMVREHALGRFRNGAFKTFTLRRPDARPMGVTVDPGGNVWYVDVKGYLGMIAAKDAGK